MECPLFRAALLEEPCPDFSYCMRATPKPLLCLLCQALGRAVYPHSFHHLPSSLQLWEKLRGPWGFWEERRGALRAQEGSSLDTECWFAAPTLGEMPFSSPPWPPQLLGQPSLVWPLHDPKREIDSHADP